MTDEELKIARALVKCSAWKWLPGMLLRDLTRSKRGRVHKVGNDWVVYFGINSESRYRCETVGYSVVPDITDPATLGCIVRLVRDARSAPSASTLKVSTGWSVWSDKRLGLGRTEAEALLRALQAAPEAS